MCVFLLPAVVANVPFFLFPSFGAVHEVPILVLCRNMHPCHCHINLPGLHQLCSRSLVCLTLLVRHLEGIIERSRGLGFARLALVLLRVCMEWASLDSDLFTPTEHSMCTPLAAPTTAHIMSLFVVQPHLGRLFRPTLRNFCKK